MESPEEILKLLIEAIKSGVDAADLLAAGSKLIPAIWPTSFGEATESQMAMYTATEIKVANSDLDELTQNYNVGLLGIGSGVQKRTIGDRYDRAGRVYGVSGRQAREKHYRERNLMRLAMKLYERGTGVTSAQDDRHA